MLSLRSTISCVLLNGNTWGELELVGTVPELRTCWADKDIGASNLQLSGALLAKAIVSPVSGFCKDARIRAGIVVRSGKLLIGSWVAKATVSPINGLGSEGAGMRACNLCKGELIAESLLVNDKFSPVTGSWSEALFRAGILEIEELVVALAWGIEDEQGAGGAGAEAVLTFGSELQFKGASVTGFSYILRWLLLEGKLTANVCTGGWFEVAKLAWESIILW